MGFKNQSPRTQNRSTKPTPTARAQGDDEDSYLDPQNLYRSRNRRKQPLKVQKVWALFELRRHRTSLGSVGNGSGRDHWSMAILF